MNTFKSDLLIQEMSFNVWSVWLH